MAFSTNITNAEATAYATALASYKSLMLNSSNSDADVASMLSLKQQLGLDDGQVASDEAAIATVTYLTSVQPSAGDIASAASTMNSAASTYNGYFASVNPTLQAYLATWHDAIATWQQKVKRSAVLQGRINEAQKSAPRIYG